MAGSPKQSKGLTATTVAQYTAPIHAVDRADHISGFGKRVLGSDTISAILQGGFQAGDLTNDNDWVDLGTLTLNSGRVTALASVENRYTQYRWKYSANANGGSKADLTVSWH
jgi:hypothetical protein